MRGVVLGGVDDENDVDLRGRAELASVFGELGWRADDFALAVGEGLERDIAEIGDFEGVVEVV